MKGRKGKADKKSGASRSVAIHFSVMDKSRLAPPKCMQLIPIFFAFFASLR
jgi:hypothetical protein